ncbi:MAG: TetR family transcriptional regulator, partial [Dehalococcoidia bacterium]|nr:TetR family transcriptional regulator [Dehalococcoidia bacterium]
VYERRFQELVDTLEACGCVTSSHPRTRLRMVLSAGSELGRWFRPGGPLDEQQVAEIYSELGLAALAPSRHEQQPAPV